MPRMRSSWRGRLQRGPAKRTATAIETYRQEFSVGDPENALGGEPNELGQRSAWRDAQRDLERAQRELAHAGERDLGRELG